MFQRRGCHTFLRPAGNGLFEKVWVMGHELLQMLLRLQGSYPPPPFCISYAKVPN